MKERLYASDKFTNRRLWEVLPDNSWKGKPCYLVGGGPSLRDFDWDLLKGKRTIGINRAYEQFEPTIIFSMDLRFLNWIQKCRYGAETTDRFRNSKSYKVWLATKTISLHDDIYIVPVHESYTKGFRAFTESMHDGLGHGNNSGYAALNLAACLGANPIYLLGFDMSHIKNESGNITHWHEGHPSIQEEKSVKNYALYFGLIADTIKERKIRVINLNPESALTCFKKKPYEEVLH